MFDNPVYNYPIERILEELGCEKGGRDMWCSPFREEHTPSFHVNPRENVWFDHGIGEGGTNVKLLMMAKGLEKKEAERWILERCPELRQAQGQPRTAGGTERRSETGDTGVKQNRTPVRETARQAPKKLEIVETSRLKGSDYYLLNYVQSRNVDPRVAMTYCDHVVVRNNEKRQNYDLLGFMNTNGGYALKAPSGFKMTNKAGISIINTEGQMNDLAKEPQSKSVSVFEGFFDFMSWLTLQNTTKPFTDVVVLNSVTNLERALDYLGKHEQIYAFTDRDQAGRQCLDKMREYFPGKEVKDMSDLYKQHNDLNEMLMASAGYKQGHGQHR